jgi:uncharacterized Fe-S cluster-containing radical SAM superfamily protein
MVERLRKRIIRPEAREILVSRLEGSSQEDDLSSPVNCGGIGRIRHFRKATPVGWPDNFLPIDPAANALGLPIQSMMEAQVFQNAACAWRCWYCYVPFELLGGDERRSEWHSAAELVRRYAELEHRPPILDLSGGSPDLTPEWVPWTIDALIAEGLADSTYLWSDDNLSSDLLFELLTPLQVRQMREAKYGRVCCFKGFDAESFAFNTGASPDEFDKQFGRFARYLDLGLDLYAYITLTGPSSDRVEEKVGEFAIRLANIWPECAVRTVPLRIEPFGPMLTRTRSADISIPLGVQERAIAVWNEVAGPRHRGDINAPYR